MKSQFNSKDFRKEMKFLDEEFEKLMERADQLLALEKKFDEIKKKRQEEDMKRILSEEKNPGSTLH